MVHLHMESKTVVLHERLAADIAGESTIVVMNPHVISQGLFPRVGFTTNVALVHPLAHVSDHVFLDVAL